MSESTFPKSNNLDLLRLLFALQVVLSHTAAHLGLSIPSYLTYFPGVPAFFFVSGFLIYASYINAPGKNYIYNRFLRLFPGLFFVVIVGGGGLILLTKGADIFLHEYRLIFLWFLAQLSIGQAFNPAIFRDIGVGVINGSLWTITVEIIFYAVVPIIISLEKKFKNIVFVLTIFSLAFYCIAPFYFDELIYREKSLYNFFELTPLAWGWMFGIGILSYKFFHLITRFLPFLYLFLLPILFLSSFEVSVGNRLDPVYFICYAALIIYVAFHLPAIPLKIDLSYGLYIWHMPVINYLIVLDLPSPYPAIVLTLLIAATSWILVEKPALKLKHTALRH